MPKYSHRRIYLAIGIILSLLIFFLVTTYNSDSKITALNKFDHCNAQRNITSEKCQEKILINYTKANGAYLGSKLLSAYANSKKVEFNCHNLAHSLGYYVQMKEPQNTIKAQTQVCGGGYLHGVFQYAAKKNPVNEIVKIGLTLCKSSSQDRQSCNHGIGHALNLAKVPLLEASQICGNISKKLEDNAISQRARQDINFQCISGWIMEESQKLQSKAIKTNTPQEFPSALSSCSVLNPNSINYQFCMISWGKEEVNSFSNKQYISALAKLTSLKKYCNSLPQDKISLKKIPSINSTTGNSIVDLCFNELGSILASNDNFSQSPERTVKNINKICGTNPTTTYLCVRNFVTRKVEIESKNLFYFTKLCSSFDSAIKEICLEKFKK